MLFCLGRVLCVSAWSCPVTMAGRRVCNPRNRWLVVLTCRIGRDADQGCPAPRPLDCVESCTTGGIAVPLVVVKPRARYHVDLPFEGILLFLGMLLLIGFGNHHLLVQHKPSRGLYEWKLHVVLWESFLCVLDPPVSWAHKVSFVGPRGCEYAGTALGPDDCQGCKHAMHCGPERQTLSWRLSGCPC